MADLEGRFRRLNNIPAPDLWPEIELAASQREPARFMDRAVLIAPLALAAVLVLFVLGPLLQLLSGTFGGAPPAPVATVVPTLLPAASEERWDPAYFGTDHDTWDVIADFLPEEGSGLAAPRHHQLRAEWVDGKLCVEWQGRIGRSDDLFTGLGSCATWDELTTDRGTTGHVVEMVGSVTGPPTPAHVEYHPAWAILNPAIARVEVVLASGETLVPELHPMASGPRGEVVRLAWVHTLSPVMDVAV
jgi:hypothetical protein